MRDSKGRRKTWFPSLFCPVHERSCTYERCKYDVFKSISLLKRLCSVQKERTNQGFSSPFDSSAFPFRRLRILLRKTLPAIGLLLAYGRVDVRLCDTALSRFCESKDGLQHTPLAPPEQGRRRKRGAPKKIFTHSLWTMLRKKRRPTAYAVGRQNLRKVDFIEF